MAEMAKQRARNNFVLEDAFLSPKIILGLNMLVPYHLPLPNYMVEFNGTKVQQLL